MDGWHIGLIVLLFLACLRIGLQRSEIQELHKGADLKNNRIDRLRETIKQESDQVRKLQDDYQRIREILDSMLVENSRRDAPNINIDMVNRGSEARHSLNVEDIIGPVVDEPDEEVQEVIKDAIRPIRFRRSKNGES
jgi:hypothetical protein